MNVSARAVAALAQTRAAAVAARSKVRILAGIVSSDREARFETREFILICKFSCQDRLLKA
jgi:hypothetical protein